jgi:hypothetical protein
MTIRDLPRLSPFRLVVSLSVSDASHLLSCPLRVAFRNDPTLRALRPTASSALLGTAAHEAVAAMGRAVSSNGAHATRATKEVARESYDAALRRLCEKRDETIRSRGALPGESTEGAEQLPYYALTRARFVRFCRQRFGDEWTFGPPLWSLNRDARGDDRNVRIGTRSEVSLHEDNGVLRGIADAVVVDERGSLIEEFKTGDMTEEHLEAWTMQLQLYGHLYERRFGAAPRLLRIHAIGNETRDVPFDSALAQTLANRVLEALQELDEKIDRGTSAAELARPQPALCASCPNRAWCAPYWSSASHGDGDLDGVVVATDGWKVSIDQGGTERTVDFRWYGVLPSIGARIRILGARVVDGATSLNRNSSVWRVPV